MASCVPLRWDAWACEARMKARGVLEPGDVVQPGQPGPQVVAVQLGDSRTARRRHAAPRARAPARPRSRIRLHGTPRPEGRQRQRLYSPHVDRPPGWRGRSRCSVPGPGSSVETFGQLKRAVHELTSRRHPARRPRSGRGRLRGQHRHRRDRAHARDAGTSGRRPWRWPTSLRASCISLDMTRLDTVLDVHADEAGAIRHLTGEASGSSVQGEYRA